MLPGLELAVVLLALLVAVTAESALRFASRSQLEDVLRSAQAKARYLRYLDKGEVLTAFCVLVRICATLAIVAIVVSGPRGAGRSIFTVAALTVVLALALELCGRILGRRWSTAALVVLLPPLRWLSLLLVPLFQIRKVFKTASTQQDNHHMVRAAEEEIRVAIEDGATEGALEAEEKEMIEGILEFHDAAVHEIMTPRTEMECLEANTPLPEALRLVAEFNHSRIPVYEGDRDRIVGILYVKDLLPCAFSASAGELTLSELVREPNFIPETKRIDELLRQFQREHAQIAVVLDEYAGVAGLVTVEDILEEIVGEIQDEYDQEATEARVRRHSPTVIDVDARVHIDEVNKELGTRLPEDEGYETVGGLVMTRFARIPGEGEQIQHHDVLFKVLQSSERSVQRVLLQIVEPETPNRNG